MNLDNLHELINRYEENMDMIYSAEVTASYGGEKFDPSVHGDDLADKVLKGIVNSYSYEYDSKEEQPNTVKVNI